MGKKGNWLGRNIGVVGQFSGMGMYKELGIREYYAQKIQCSSYLTFILHLLINTLQGLLLELD
jgi:hypothetical protein